MQPVRAVVFDMGNTLWFEAASPDVARIFRMEAERLAPLVDAWDVGLPALDEIVRDVWDAYMAAWNVEKARGTLRDPSLPFLIRGALAVRGIEISDGQAQAWWRTAYLPVREFGWQLYPDTLDVLGELKQMGLLVGINTNRPFVSEMFAGDLDDYGLTPYVDAMVCSGDTGYVKPHPSTFELVLRRLGVAAGEAVMVGDSAEADMAGAKAAGMRTVWKLNGRYNPPDCPDADHQIHDLSELLALPIFPRRRSAALATESPTPHEDGNAERY